METILAVCGLVCTDCPAYQATQANDQAWLEQVATQWREEFQAPNITAEYARCNGCLAQDAKLCGHCSECNVRLCAVERGLENCGLCPDYGCEKITTLMGFMPESKVRLDAIHAVL
jgi:hypothetical protein